MSAKLLYNLSDENPNLKKQIGCMNGIFQVFYRQHYPARRVAVAADELRSQPLGKTNDNIVNANITTEKSNKKKKQRGISSETSSRQSFSSSPCSSSFSSADISTTTSPLEQSGLVQVIDKPVREPTNGSPRWGGLKMPTDLREFVRSSMHKETVPLSQQPQTPTRNANEWSEGRKVTKLKDSPRFSYDERETRKTVPKVKEIPRLSLDSRSNSFRSARSSCSPEPQEGHRRTTSSVVARLMGLDVIPDEPVTEQKQNRFCDSPRPTPRVEERSDSVKKMMFPMRTADYAATTVSVYGEIQKRLSQLEFKKSEKDLRALKQILEAMEKTQQLSTDQPIPSAATKTRRSSMDFRTSSIVVMKATATAPVSPRNVALPNVKVGTPRNNKTMDETPKSAITRPLQSKKDLAKPGKPSVSPKAVQPKKQSTRPTSPKPEHNKNKRPQRQQQTETASPRRKPKSRSPQQSEDRLSDESSDFRSLKSDSNVSLSSSSNLDTEVTSKYQRNNDNTDQTQSPKPLKVTVEQPSPVSVLDIAAFDEDDSPSPVRKISITTEHNNICRSIIWPESNAPHTELIDGFEFKNDDHKYIAAILLAAGLLRDIDYSMISLQLHQAHVPINPSLFFVLEQNKTTQHDNNKHKRSERKLVFDSVNEILAKRFAAEGCTKQQSLSTSVKISRGRELLDTLCLEVERLQGNSKCVLDEDDGYLIWEDLESQGMKWKKIQGETPGLVLDVERLVFKDLISEVAEMLRGQPI